MGLGRFYVEVHYGIVLKTLLPLVGWCKVAQETRLKIFDQNNPKVQFETTSDQKRGEVCRHVTMVAKCLDDNSRELKQRRWRRQRKWQKSNRFRLAKQQLCTCITLFCTFLSRRCTTATWNFLISRVLFMEQVNTTPKISFPFCKLRYLPFGFNPEISPIFYKLNELE